MKLDYNDLNIDLILGDCLEKMKEIPDNAIDLVVMDPPYNIKKDKEWDNYKNDVYISLMISVFAELHRILKDNGQMYFFHNNLPIVSELVHYLNHGEHFAFNSFLIFPKKNWRAQSYKNCKDTNNLRNWFNICEYALHYTNKDSLHTEWDKTGWDRVRLDTNNFSSLRQYAYDMLCYIGKNLQGGQNHTAVNKLRETLDIDEQNTSSIVIHAKRRVFSTIGGKADHFMRYGSTQWSLPTSETYRELTEKYNLKNWEKYREYEDLRQEYEDLRQEYEDLRQEYEDLRPVHNLDPDHCNVWEVQWRQGKNYHICQKPVSILERMIRTSSKPGAVVLDCFMGSGSTGIACINTDRHFIGIEKDPDIYKTAENRIKEHIEKLSIQTA